MNQFTEEHWNSTTKRLTIGFFISLVLLISIYMIVAHQLIEKSIACYVIVGLAFLQAIVQLICFLHLGTEQFPYWSNLLFIFMLIILTIIVLGSVWIMYNLNYNMMMPM